jgi:hypothetical protein
MFAASAQLQLRTCLCLSLNGLCLSAGTDELRSNPLQQRSAAWGTAGSTSFSQQAYNQQQQQYGGGGLMPCISAGFTLQQQQNPQWQSGMQQQQQNFSMQQQQQWLMQYQQQQRLECQQQYQQQQQQAAADMHRSASAPVLTMRKIRSAGWTAEELITATGGAAQAKRIELYLHFVDELMG